MWYVYILKCSDGTYYTGISENIKNRILDHNRGKGSEYTKLRRPVKLVYFEELEKKENAALREREIKKFGKSRKEKLIKHGNGKRVSLASEN